MNTYAIHFNGPRVTAKVQARSFEDAANKYWNSRKRKSASAIMMVKNRSTNYICAFMFQPPTAGLTRLSHPAPHREKKTSDKVHEVYTPLGSLRFDDQKTFLYKREQFLKRYRVKNDLLMESVICIVDVEGFTEKNRKRLPFPLTQSSDWPWPRFREEQYPNVIRFKVKDVENDDMAINISRVVNMKNAGGWSLYMAVDHSLDDNYDALVLFGEPLENEVIFSFEREVDAMMFKLGLN